MRPNDGAIRNQRFHVWLVSEVSEELPPNPALFPTGEAFVDTIPVAIFGREQTPARTTPGHPEYRFDEASGLEFIPDIEVGTELQERIDALPSVIS